MIKLPDTPITQYIPIEWGIIKTIRLAVADQPGSDIIMSIIWDEMSPVRLPEMEQQGIMSANGISRRSDTVIRCPIDWILPSDIEGWLSQIGWRIGAGYMYRWHKSPIDASDTVAKDSLSHIIGVSSYVINGVDTIIGDRDTEDVLADMIQYGHWEWEINCSYRKYEGSTALFWPSWKAHDNTLQDDGSRRDDFPGWHGNHPYLRAVEPRSAYESRYFYSKPKRFNKHTDILPKHFIVS